MFENKHRHKTVRCYICGKPFPLGGDKMVVITKQKPGQHSYRVLTVHRNCIP